MYGFSSKCSLHCDALPVFFSRDKPRGGCARVWVAPLSVRCIAMRCLFFFRRTSPGEAVRVCGWLPAMGRYTFWVWLRCCESVARVLLGCVGGCGDGQVSVTSVKQ